ncbi:MAG: hypothetical protein Q9157_003973 [Trypethelium eluteriae]
MDPLSVTASLIAVSGALGTSVKALQKVASLRHAPSELLSLHNEVNSLRTFLRIVNQTFQDGGHLELPPESIEGLRTVKLTLESHVQELDNLSQYQLKRSEVPNKDGTPKVARLAWLRVGKDIACLQRKIRDSRLDLQSIFSVLSLQSNIRVLSVIENVSLPAQTGASPQSSRTSASDPQLMQSISDLLRSYRASMAEPNIDSDRSPRILLECDPKARRLSDGSNSQPDSRCSGLIEDSVRGGQSNHFHRTPASQALMKFMLNPNDENFEQLAGLFDRTAALGDAHFNEIHLAVLGLSDEPLSTCLQRNFQLVNSTSRDGTTPLALALERGDFSAFEILLEWQADVWKTTRGGNTSLHQACKGGCPTALHLLLQTGLNPSQSNYDGTSPLHTLAYYKHSSAEMVRMIDLLLEYGANIDARTSHGLSPLYIAARKGNKACLEACIARGADVNLRVYCGWTVLAEAVEAPADKHCSECIRSLLDAQADVSALLPGGRNILHQAAQRSPTASMAALSRAASFQHVNPEARDETGKTPQQLFDWIRDWFVNDEDPEAARAAFSQLMAAARRDYVGREQKADQRSLRDQSVPGAWPNE